MLDEPTLPFPIESLPLVARTELRDVRLVSVMARNQERPVERTGVQASWDAMSYRTEPGTLFIKLTTNVRYYAPPAAAESAGSESAESVPDETSPEVGSLSVVHLAELSLEGDHTRITPEQAEDFFASTILFMMFPYIRASVHRFSIDLQLPPTVLPYLRHGMSMGWEPDTEGQPEGSTSPNE